MVKDGMAARSASLSLTGRSAATHSPLPKWVRLGLRRARLRRPLYPDEPTCSGCPQSMYASSAPSLSANVGLALPAFARRKKRRARDATHTSGLFVLNSIFLRMNQAHRSGADKRQRFDHPPTLGLSGRTRGSKSDLDARNRMSALTQ
jgi:hypothetical protein